MRKRILVTSMIIILMISVFPIGVNGAVVGEIRDIIPQSQMNIADVKSQYSSDPASDAIDGNNSTI